MAEKIIRITSNETPNFTELKSIKNWSSRDFSFFLTSTLALVCSAAVVNSTCDGVSISVDINSYPVIEICRYKLLLSYQPEVPILANRSLDEQVGPGMKIVNLR